MSAALTFLVAGNVYNFFGNTSLLPATHVQDGVPVFNLTEINAEPPVHKSVQRDDYNYTTDVGAHKVHTQAAIWNDARMTCKKEGGDLAVVNSAAEAEVIRQLIAASGSPIGADDYGYYSVGFHDLFKEGQYETIHGQLLSETGYNEWASGEPNNDGTGENCGTITVGGKLNDGGCNRRYAFVCELPNAD